MAERNRELPPHLPTGDHGAVKVGDEGQGGRRSRTASTPGRTWSGSSSSLAHRHDRHDRLVDRHRRAARGAGQPDQDAEPVEGALVLPRPPGDARLLRPLDRRRRPADADHRRADGHPVHRHQPEGERLLHFKERKFAIITFLFGFLVLWIVADHHRHVHARPGWTAGPVLDSGEDAAS